MTQLISPEKFTKTVDLLRSFFLRKGFLEVHTQNRLSILAACEDPFNVATYNYNGKVWPLPQTGQMWLEHELLTKPDSKGFFCVSTSYRQEKNPVKGRHESIFPMCSHTLREPCAQCVQNLARTLREHILQYLLAYLQHPAG